MQFVNNLNNLVVDDQYFMELPTPPSSASVPTGNIGIVGTFSRGAVNTPIGPFTSYADLVKKMGEVDPAFTLTGTIAARGVFKQGNASVWVVRAQSSTTPAAAATVPVMDTSTTPKTVMTLTASTPGTWGNSLSATVTAGTKTSTFKVQLQYGSESETWDNLIIAQPATPIAGAVLASTVFGPGGQSQLATATYPATPVTTPWALSTYNLTGGTDGATTLPADYVGTNTGGVKTGLFALDSVPANIVFCAEQSDTSINTALLNNARDITLAGGTPRMAVITFPQATSVSAASALTAAMDSDRGIAAYPWLQISDYVTGSNKVVSPLGYFAGVLAQIKPHQSPGNKRVYGTIGTDPAVNIGPSDLATLIGSRINAVGVQTPAGGIGIRTGLTLSQSNVLSYVRRMKDFINSQVNVTAGVFVDEPITNDLMRRVKQSVDNVLYPMKNPTTPSDQMVADYSIVCDASNNPPSVIGQNQLICDYAVKLLNINRFMVFRTQIGAGVVITTQQS